MSVQNVYRFVIDDVIKNGRIDFQNEGVDENILHQLQQLWESRLMQSGVLPGAIASDDYSHQYHAPGAYHHQQYPGEYPLYLSGGHAEAYPQQAYGTPHTGPSFPSLAAPSPQTPGSAVEYELQNQLGRPTPQQYMPTPNAWTPEATESHPPAQGKRAPAKPAGRGGRGQGNLPQHDGANDEESEKYLTAKEIDKQIFSDAWREQQKPPKKNRSQRNISQLDGDDDEDDDDDDLGEPVGKPAKDDDSLGKEGEELDDPDLDISDEEPETDHLILCQFEKVTRVKNKRKANLKDGIMNLNGKDYLFHKSTGECDW